MILIIDNYDSFTYNLYQMVGELKEEVIVKRNDEITLEDLESMQPQKIIISPGPGKPQNQRDFGICMQVIKEFKDRKPILGVCLGHQGIFAAFGGKIIRTQPVHGKQVQVFHKEDGIFKAVENPMLAARYHSLICSEKAIPDCIEVIAKTDDGTIMGIKHQKNPIFGLQFHPESIGTSQGSVILTNFLEIQV